MTGAFLILAGGAAAVAQPTATPAATAASAAAADTIVVTGDRIQYGVRATSTATKTDTDVRNIPQAMTVISSGQIADQQLRSVADLLTFVPGASYGSGEGNRDQLVLRGNASTADFFIDGVRDDVQYFRDFYNVDRVEILKGPNAMIFGRGGGGGIVNRVLKRPSLTAYRSLTASADGFGGARFDRRHRSAARRHRRARVNGLYEDSGSFRRHVDVKRYGINPTIALLAGPARGSTSATNISTTAAPRIAAFPPTATSRSRGFARTFFGDPDDSYARANVDLATLAVEHSFGDGLTLRNRTLFGDYDKFYQNIYRAARFKRRDRDWSRSAPTTTATTARTCSARPISSGRTASAASTRRCCWASSSAARSRATFA